MAGHQPRAQSPDAEGRLRKSCAPCHILDHYLRAVRLYLPKGPQQDDIVEEIAEHLTARLEDEAASLGRPLTETEEQAVLTRHGSPRLVAERYGVAQRGFAFGRQLISPRPFRCMRACSRFRCRSRC